MMSGLDIHYDLGEGHPLLGRRMPDLDLVTADGPLRVFTLLHEARPVLLNLGEARRPRHRAVGRSRPAGRRRVRRRRGSCRRSARSLRPRAVLIRPDGYVAWVGDGTDGGARRRADHLVRSAGCSIVRASRNPGSRRARSAFKFYEKGNVRIRYQEVGSGFPLLATPGGGLNSRISNWPNAVINAMEHFKNDFRCITMDQRNATGGESTGPVPVDDPWDAFADDQLGLMDHLGIRQFVFFGNCIGGSFALKLMERAPDRVVAAVLSQPIGHRPENPDVMYNSGRDVWAHGIPQAAARRVDGNHREVPAQPLPRAARLRVQRVARLRAQLPDADAGAAGRHAAHAYQTSVDVASLAPNAEVTVYPWKDPPELKARTIERARHFLKAHVPVERAAGVP